MMKIKEILFKYFIDFELLNPRKYKQSSKYEKHIQLTPKATKNVLSSRRVQFCYFDFWKVSLRTS